MKTLFTSALGLLLSVTAFTQTCTPDPNLPYEHANLGTQAIYPRHLPDACRSQSYSAPFYVRYRRDTTLNVPPFGSITFPIDSVQWAITGLPIGLAYTCAQNNCTETYDPNSDFFTCMNFQGTVDTVALGVYELVLTATVHVTILGSPTSLQDTAHFYLEIAPFPDTSVAQVSSVLIAAGEPGATYQWVDCSNPTAPIIGETNLVFAPTASGSYAVVATKNGCSLMSSCHTVVLASTTVLAENGLRLYPNPSREWIVIESDAPFQNADLRLVSMTGQVIDQVSGFSGNRLDYRLPDLPAGLYVVEIAEEKGIARLKVQVE